jgi:hypothetical protein
VPLGAPPPTGAPPVTVVPFQPLVPEPAGCRATFNDAQVSFRAGSGEFLDPERSIATIQEVASHLRDAGCVGEVALIATTSSADTAADRDRVARARIATVLPVLAAGLGVDAAQIATYPVGYDPAYCAPDRDAAGRLVPALAQACRQVIITVGAEVTR